MAEDNDFICIYLSGWVLQSSSSLYLSSLPNFFVKSEWNSSPSSIFLCENSNFFSAQIWKRGGREGRRRHTLGRRNKENDDDGLIHFPLLFSKEIKFFQRILWWAELLIIWDFNSISMVMSFLTSSMRRLINKLTRFENGKKYHFILLS